MHTYSRSAWQHDTKKVVVYRRSSGRSVEDGLAQITPLEDLGMVVAWVAGRPNSLRSLCLCRVLFLILSVPGITSCLLKGN